MVSASATAPSQSTLQSKDSALVSLKNVASIPSALQMLAVTIAKTFAAALQAIFKTLPINVNVNVDHCRTALRTTNVSGRQGWNCYVSTESVTVIQLFQSMQQPNVLKGIDTIPTSLLDSSELRPHSALV